MKTCIKCNTTKTLSGFGRSKRKLDGVSTICKECNNARSREYNIRKKENRKKISSIYYKNNKDIINSNNKKWRTNNKKYFREYQNKYRTERRKKDIIYDLSIKVRKLISNSFSRSGYKKKSITYEILGCSFDEFKLHIESRFEYWMTWENRGLYNDQLNYGWDIDHIIPISSVLTEEDIIKLNHYTNLQPLCSHINRDIKRAIVLF